MELPKVLGRAAVPVRLIPHLAPCLSAEELALILARQDPRCKWDLSAHWLRQDGTVGEMHPDEWHGVALEIGLLPAQPGVILQATMSLPEGVFVWRDELESEYPKFIGEDGAYSPSVTNGNEDYEGSGALSFERRPPPHSELIYAGFEHALADWPRIARGAELHGDAKELDTTAPSDGAPVQAAVQGPSEGAAEPVPETPRGQPEFGETAAVSVPVEPTAGLEHAVNPRQSNGSSDKAPAEPMPKVRRGWKEVAGPFMVERLRTGQFATAVELNHALHTEAGAGESPFERGTGLHRGSLYIRELAAPLALKTIQNNWAKLKEEASKS